MSAESWLPIDAPMRVGRFEDFDGKETVLLLDGERVTLAPVSPDLIERLKRAWQGDECAVAVDAAGRLTGYSPVLRATHVVATDENRLTLADGNSATMDKAVRVIRRGDQGSLVDAGDILEHMRGQLVRVVRQLDEAGVPSGAARLIALDLTGIE